MLKGFFYSVRYEVRLFWSDFLMQMVQLVFGYSRRLIELAGRVVLNGFGINVKNDRPSLDHSYVNVFVEGRL